MQLPSHEPIVAPTAAIATRHSRTFLNKHGLFPVTAPNKSPAALKAACWCDAGMTITFHIWKANERVATVEYAPPLTAGDARRGLQDEDSSWIGVLQAEGTSVRLPPQHVLADGATYELILQRQRITVAIVAWTACQQQIS